MPDIEKVIEALECCKAYYINKDLTGHDRCPYNGRNNGDGCDKLLADALELLKCSRLIHTEHALYTVYEKHNGEQNV